MGPCSPPLSLLFAVLLNTTRSKPQPLFNLLKLSGELAATPLNGFHLHYVELSLLSGIPCCKTWDALPLFLLLLSPSPASNSIKGHGPGATRVLTWGQTSLQGDAPLLPWTRVYPTWNSYQRPQAGYPEMAAGAWSRGEWLLSWAEERLLPSSQVLSLPFQMILTGTESLPPLAWVSGKGAEAMPCLQPSPACCQPSTPLSFIINRASCQCSSHPARRHSGLNTSPPSTLHAKRPMQAARGSSSQSSVKILTKILMKITVKSRGFKPGKEKLARSSPGLWSMKKPAH